jgi:outer membrane protein TolC
MNRCAEKEKTGRLGLRLGLGAFLTAFLFGAGIARGQSSAPAATNVFSHPLSRAEAVDLALRHNSDILKGKSDLQAAHGIVIQLRSIAYPTLSAGGNYNREQSTLIENFPLPASGSSNLSIKGGG